jgi:predicted metal-dependent phosphoesterase TrpH
VKATPGYKPNPLQAGRWEIIVGAYQIAAEGVQVTYEIETTFKQRRLLKGDLHMHTGASDGVQTAEELAWRAKRHGLDFIAITDHNQTINSESLPRVDGVTVISGLEWTHYKAHANFLGCDQPYDGSFIANNRDEISAHFNSAHQRGATIVANHPFDEACPFQLELASLPIDLIEVWNGPMRESNLKAIGYWHNLLLAGQKVAISGGSDFHRDTPFLFLGGPTTCVYALSNSPADILEALRQGHAFITFAPDGPTLSMHAGDAFLGDSIQFQAGLNLQLGLNGLLKGDVVRLVTQA